MTFTQRLELRQSQSLVMTPQLQQAIKLLQLNNLEITDFVNQELQQNPLLEEGERSDADKPDANLELGQDRVGAPDSDAPADCAADAELIAAGALSQPTGNVPDEGEAPLDAGPAMSSFGDTGGRFDGEVSDFADRLSREPTLREHLLGQLNTEITEPRERLIGAALIEAVEPSGYVRQDDVEATAANLGIDVTEVETVLQRLQRFEPVGVMARTLGECLAIQLRERDRFDPAMAVLCDNLEMLAARRFNDLCRLCGVDSADLSDMIKEIRALAPKPGDQFQSSAADTVIPDILMRPAHGGGWTIELNPETLPRVLVNRRYFAEINRTCRNAKEKEYLSERLNAANWLVRSLDQRANTILKVAGEIVNQQEAFFRHGISHLRPLVLRNIAEIIGMHESTISRVTSNKYMSTPRGMFELKYFFSAAIQRSDGGEGAHSAESIRHRLRTLIEAENPAAILSDDSLVEQMQGEGIDIARRTVAKYREQLGIPSSVQRRRQKSFSAASAR